MVDIRPGGPGTTNEEESDRPSWTYLTMELLPSPSAALVNPSTIYHTSLEAAVAHSTTLAAKSTPPIPIPSLPTRSSPPPTTLPPQQNPHEMADGEGTTPGAYGNSEDFWSGWTEDENDGENTADVSMAKPSLFVSHQVPMAGDEAEMDEDEDEFNSTGFCMNTVNAQRAESDLPQPHSPRSPIIDASTKDSEFSNADADYWASYGDGGSSIGDDDYQRQDVVIPPPAAAVVRPHRSSTIKAPIGITSNALPSLLSRDVLSTGSTSSIETERPSQTVEESLYRLPTPDSPSTISKSIPTTNQDSVNKMTDDALRSTLEGVWKLYSLTTGATARGTAERFLELAREVSTSQVKREL